MKNINTAYETVITKAAMEAGIKANENYSVIISSIEGSLICFELETEWNRVTCYADTNTNEVLGIMAEAKTIEEILWGPASVVAAAGSGSVKAA